MNFFILPGNPPARYFYELWAAEIRERHPDARIEVAKYPLTPDIQDSRGYFRDLTNLLTKQFLEFRDREGANISLVGHSLGGYLALKVLEKIPDDVESCYLLHPFLRQPMPLGRAILKLAHTLKYLPSFEKWLVRAQPLIGSFLDEALKITSEEIHVFAQLAYHEHLTISQDLSPPDIDPHLIHKVHVYSTEGDIWCPPSTVASLGEAVKR